MNILDFCQTFKNGFVDLCWLIAIMIKADLAENQLFWITVYDVGYPFLHHWSMAKFTRLCVSHLLQVCLHWFMAAYWRTLRTLFTKTQKLFALQIQKKTFLEKETRDWSGTKFGNSRPEMAERMSSRADRPFELQRILHRNGRRGWDSDDETEEPIINQSLIISESPTCRLLQG